MYISFSLHVIFSCSVGKILSHRHLLGHLHSSQSSSLSKDHFRILIKEAPLFQNTKPFFPKSNPFHMSIIGPTIGLPEEAASPRLSQ